MPLKKTSGNMYNWITHTHSHLAGECPHKCHYCYVQKNRFGVPEKYKGKTRLIASELGVNYGSDKTIFIEHMGDLFANGICDHWILYILEHCRQYNKNTYIFQSKNPERALIFLEHFPENFIFGTTIETNRNELLSKYSKAPLIQSRLEGIKELRNHCETFITIEPIISFDDIFSDLLIYARPDFINIWADSKHCNLKEPSKEKVINLIKRLKEAKIEVREKSNLKRLIK
jgi:DNA repair photolyase